MLRRVAPSFLRTFPDRSDLRPAVRAGQPASPHFSIFTVKAFFNLLALPVLTAAAHGAVLVKYDFNDAEAGTALTTAYSNFVRGAYVGTAAIQDPTSYLDEEGGVGNVWDGNVLRGTIRQNPVGSGIYIVDDAAAVQRAAYFSFTYTPTAGTSLTSITFDAATDTFDPGGPMEDIREVGIVLRSSLTGLGVNNGLGSVLLQSGMEIGGKQQVTFDLSGISAFENVTDPVTFFFYMNTNGVNTTLPFYIDDLALNGNVVPEPASFSLLAIGGMGLLVRRRRRGA